MAKLVKVTIDEATAQVDIDLQGFHGQGCDAVLKAFASVGTTLNKEFTKPEFRQQAQVTEQTISGKQ
jgi:hypothetical protein